MKHNQVRFAQTAGAGATLGLAVGSLLFQLLSPSSASAYNAEECAEAGWNEENQCCDEDAIGNCCWAQCFDDVYNVNDCLAFYPAWVCHGTWTDCSDQCRGEAELGMGCGVEVLYCS